MVGKPYNEPVAGYWCIDDIDNVCTFGFLYSVSQVVGPGDRPSLVQKAKSAENYQNHHRLPPLNISKAGQYWFSGFCRFFGFYRVGKNSIQYFSVIYLAN